MTRKTFGRKIVMVGDTKGITIPKDILEKMKLDLGDYLEVTIKKL